jgi:ribulose bisphosphate carboxylase small subunit
MIKNPSSNLTILLENNKVFVNEYINNSLMQLIKSDAMKEKYMRKRLLDCIQVFSDYFQKVVMLRYVFCDNPKFFSVAQLHLTEEYGHNISLKQDREHRPSVWDPILESTSSWFAWKMFTLDEEEKTVLVHLVLEASAHLFFTQAHQIMERYQETEYFKIHSDADEQHEQMGIGLLKELTVEKYQQLQKILSQGWTILNTACNQIALLTQQESF